MNILSKIPSKRRFSRRSIYYMVGPHVGIGGHSQYNVTDRFRSHLYRPFYCDQAMATSRPIPRLIGVVDPTSPFRQSASLFRWRNRGASGGSHTSLLWRVIWKPKKRIPYFFYDSIWAVGWCAQPSDIST